ncbi:hypothetical protein [Streptomyces axinellae]|uniref:Uncharacterized protein n=1 Tax=Streptomyces axinellae TaxID=552788 RepID=A0ABN3QX31_9ACTN
MTEHGDGGDAPDTKGVKPGDGYRVEIATLRRILKPLEESVVAARKIKDDWKPMAEHIHDAATMDIVTPTDDVLSKWGFGMGRVAEHTDTVIETLNQVIAAYMLADLLRIKDFAPTADNIAKLPFGEHGLREWNNGSRPKFDPPPQIWQEPWLDDDGTTVTGDVPTNPRKRYDGGWEVDGGGGGTIA